MVATWLTELQLDQINRALLDDEGEAGPECQVMSPSPSPSPAHPTAVGFLSPSGLVRFPFADQAQPLVPKFPFLRSGSQALIEKLKGFLTEYRDVLDDATTSNLLASYGRLDELMHFAAMQDDNETVIEHLMQRGEVPPLSPSSSSLLPSMPYGCCFASPCFLLRSLVLLPSLVSLLPCRLNALLPPRFTSVSAAAALLPTALPLFPLTSNPDSPSFPLRLSRLPSHRCSPEFLRSFSPHLPVPALTPHPPPWLYSSAQRWSAPSESSDAPTSPSSSSTSLLRCSWRRLPARRWMPGLKLGAASTPGGSCLRC